MARPRRIEFAGALYHVTSRGDRREAVFLSDADRHRFLALVEEVCDRFKWHCYAYCLLDHHYHLLVETPEPNLSKGMRHLNGVYTQRFNRANQHVGSVFQGRYKAIVVEKKLYFQELVRFIVLDPVTAGVAHDVGEWRWTSYNATCERTSHPAWLMTDQVLSAFGDTRGLAIENYQRYVAEGANQPSPWINSGNAICLGSEQFKRRVFQLSEALRDCGELSKRPRHNARNSLAWYAYRNKSRNDAIRQAYASGGYSMRSIGEYFGIHYSRVSRVLKKQRARPDPVEKSGEQHD